MLSLSKNVCFGEIVARTVLESFQVNTVLLNVSTEVLMLIISFPVIDSTSAVNPPPLVPSSLKCKLSPTLYPLPWFKTSNPVIPPLVTDSTIDNCFMISLDSTKKSLFAYGSLTL